MRVIETLGCHRCLAIDHAEEAKFCYRCGTPLSRSELEVEVVDGRPVYTRVPT